MSVYKCQLPIVKKMVPTLYELATNALDKAFQLLCEYLLSTIVGHIPTPVEQNGKEQTVLKRKFESEVHVLKKKQKST